MRSLDLDLIMEEICGLIHRKSFTCGRHDHHSESNIQLESIEKYSASKEKLSEATKVFISQKFATRTTEERKTKNSQELLMRFKQGIVF